MIELKDLKPGDIFASDNTSCQILEVGEDYVKEKCLRGTGKGQEITKTGGRLSFFLYWLNSKTVWKVQ